jgi:histidinol-phosphate aminotransferase
MTVQWALTDAVDALPDAVNPLALSLNENPFPPLPSVRSALMASIDAANRYPEFLPERMRALIAARVGVGDEQVVIGAGATGVVMQVLHAVTSPGDTMVMTSPTFDGYPIFAQMARLRSVTVALDKHGHHDLDAMADAAAGARVVVLCRPHNPSGTIESAADVEQFLRRVPSDTVVLLDEAYVTGLVAVAASYDAEAELHQRIRVISAEGRYLRARLAAMGVYSTDSHANFVYLPARGRPWLEVFAGTGLRVRGYADGGVRITVGGRQSSRAVLAAVALA